MIVRSKINLALYPRDQAFEMARGGDLFMLHIVSEGSALLDAEGDFEALRGSFQFRTTYAREIEHATSLGRMLMCLARTTRNHSMVNKRIAWCVRTMLIARAAESKKAIFAAGELAKFADDNNVASLIGNKDNRLQSSHILEPFERFLNTWGTAPDTDHHVENLVSTRAHFERTRNIVGLKTLDALQTDFDDHGY